MITTIISTLGYVAANIPSFVALGVDIADLFDKGKALVTSDTASTPAERETALGIIEGLQAMFASALRDLEQTAPGS